MKTTTIDLFRLFDLFKLLYAITMLSALAFFLTGCDKKDPEPKLELTSFTPESGEEGSVVTIAGKGFSAEADNNIVTFGTLAATVTDATRTQLTVTVPAGAVDGKISVTVKNSTVESTNDFRVADRWLQMADFGGPSRDNPFYFTANGKGYVGSGSHAEVDLWEYDPGNNVWTQKQNFGGGGRIYATAFGIGSKGYVTCGFFGSNLYRDVWEYDPANNTWTQKQDFAGGARFGAVSFTIGSKGYVGTGAVTSSNVAFKDLWEYDPAGDTWTKKADMPGTVVRVWAFGFAIGSNGYIGGGEARGGSSGNKYDFYEYNSTLDQWTQKSNFPDEAGGSLNICNTFVSSSKGYIGKRSQLWQFDPAANTWSRKTDPPTVVAGISFTIGEYGYLGSPYGKTFYRYFPE